MIPIRFLKRQHFFKPAAVAVMALFVFQPTFLTVAPGQDQKKNFDKSSCEWEFYKLSDAFVSCFPGW